MQTKLLFLLSLLGLLLACNPQKQHQNADNEPIAVIDPQKFDDLMKVAPDVQLLDVRTPQEFAVGHLPKAINNNIASPSFVDQAQKLDKNRPVFVYCKTGVRSHQAARELEKLGFREIYDMAGGLVVWQQKGLRIDMAP
ncbi:MAG: rhodanese-like domain-containing protein [Bernardetiaceae bacterium]